MTTALIGEFAPPHDGTTLYNHFLRDELCKTDPIVTADIGQLAGSGLVQFVRDLRKMLKGVDRLVFLSRCWDRESLFHLFVGLCVSRRFVPRIELVLHTELFAFFGPQRSRHVGWPLLRACFGLVDQIACGDEATADAVRKFCPKSTAVRVERLHVPAPLNASRAAATIAPGGQSVILVACNPDSIGLLEQAHAIADGSRRRGGERPLVVVLASGGVDVDHDDPHVAAVVRDPSTLAVRQWLARADLFVRPVRSMGACPHPSDWFMVECPDGDEMADLDDGIVVIERSIGAGADPSIVARVSNDVATVDPERAILIGTFEASCGQEAKANRAIADELAGRGVEVVTVELPADGFDGETVASFRDFVSRLGSTIQRDDAVLCLTQGYTRPSLLLLLATALTVRWRGARLFLVLHCDLFDFFGKIRSRNAGLPLLFVTFGIADFVYSSSAGQAVAQRYSRQPDKFIAVSFPDHDVTIDLTNGRPDLVDLTNSANLDDQRAARHWLVDYRRASHPTVTTTVMRRLTCDGVEIAIDSARCFDFFDNNHQLADRLVIIRKGATDVTGLLSQLDLGRQQRGLVMPKPQRKDTLYASG